MAPAARLSLVIWSGISGSYNTKRARREETLQEINFPSESVISKRRRRREGVKGVTATIADSMGGEEMEQSHMTSALRGERG